MGLPVTITPFIDAQAALTTRYTINDLLTDARRHLVRLTPAQALAAQQAGALIIDTRTPTDRDNEGVIPGSAHMARTVLEWRCDPASGHQDRHLTDFEQQIIVVCNEGYSSSLAAANLQRLGFRHATDLIGGYRRWRAEGLPTEPATSHTFSSPSAQFD